MANYYAKVIVDGGLTLLRPYIEKEFVSLYNCFCDRANAKTDEINDEYDRMYPDDMDNAKYEKFFSNRMEKICDEVNTASDRIELHSWYENGEYYGVRGYGKGLFEGAIAHLYVYEG